MSVTMCIPIEEAFSDADFHVSDWLYPREKCDDCGEELDYGEARAVFIEGLLHAQGHNTWSIFCPECARKPGHLASAGAAYLLLRDDLQNWHKVDVLKDTRPPQIWGAS